MKRLLPLLALTILMGASAATAQNYNITAPSGDGWTVPATAQKGDQVTIKYTGDKYVKNVKVVPRIESISIKPSCLTMLEGETVNLSCKVALYKNSVLTNVTDNEKFVTWSSSDLSILTVSEVGKVTALREGEATITATSVNGKTDALTITVKKIPSSYPENCIAGVFKVGQCKHVIFSKGNLQYQPSTNTWRFADKQYTLLDDDETDYHTTTSYTPTSTDWIDLFGWGMWLDEITEKAKITNTSTTNSQYAPSLTDDNEFAENHRTVDGEQWLTLSLTEWSYLIKTRATTNGIRYTKAKVHGVNGLVLLPDTWNGTYTFANQNTSGASFAEIANDDWVILESEGAVFLPAAGDRYGADVCGVGGHGRYWSSTVRDAGSAHNLRFLSDLYLDQHCGRCFGFSVRLVRSL